MTITRDDVLRVAELAHLDLSSEEVELYRAQLDEIVSYVGKLQEIDVENIEPMTQMRPRDSTTAGRPSAESEPNLRDDTQVSCHIANDVLGHAPDAVKPFFRVPKVIER